jgi:hypothetical protein
LFHDAKPDDASIPGSHSVYIPESFQPCSAGVQIFTPNNTSARAFIESDLDGFGI